MLRFDADLYLTRFFNDKRRKLESLTPPLEKLSVEPDVPVTIIPRKPLEYKPLEFSPLRRVMLDLAAEEKPARKTCPRCNGPIPWCRITGPKPRAIKTYQGDLSAVYWCQKCVSKYARARDRTLAEYRKAMKALDLKRQPWM